ncbi:MAG: hypothetical protein QM778_07275 [Myxococcales bacterium]
MVEIGRQQRLEGAPVAKHHRADELGGLLLELRPQQIEVEPLHQRNRLRQLVDSEPLFDKALHLSARPWVGLDQAREVREALGARAELIGGSGCEQLLIRRGTDHEVRQSRGEFVGLEVASGSVGSTELWNVEKRSRLQHGLDDSLHAIVEGTARRCHVENGEKIRFFLAARGTTERLLGKTLHELLGTAVASRRRTWQKPA